MPSGIVGALFLIMAFLCLVFGLRLHGQAMMSVMDALDELTGKTTGPCMRFIVMLITAVLMFASCGLILLFDMLIVVIRANKVGNTK